ncbi:MAG: dihydrofolate reductase family protein [Paludibacter sp.]|nr:dihydrofolate reductase family protein [Paludibacter sp.]
MKKLIVFNLITLEGFFEGANHSIDWHQVDEEFNKFAIEQLNNADMLFFGRLTYELMAGYWSTPDGTNDDPVIANKMNTLPKIVFSKTMEKPEWENTKLIKENIIQEITTLKNQTGKDIYILGSAGLISSLIETNLIDEYRIMINPVVIGQGTPLFQNVKHQLRFSLREIKEFKSGNVLLFYETKRV